MRSANAWRTNEMGRTDSIETLIASMARSRQPRLAIEWQAFGYDWVPTSLYLRGSSQCPRTRAGYHTVPEQLLVLARIAVGRLDMMVVAEELPERMERG